jgi:predicted lipoprotein with Yx(FWY)xxD motif
VVPRQRPRTKRRLQLALAFGAGAVPLVLAACGGTSSSAAAGSNTPTTVDSRQTTLGSIITDGNGMSVYLFEKDSGHSSTCYGACAATWTPVTTAGAPKAGPGTTASLLGTTKRTGGATQVTYAGHPLYFFTGDQKPGDVTGQGSQTFGAGWDALRPTGQKVESGGN